jgi:Tfp pilus assembly PilM family ATPase
MKGGIKTEVAGSARMAELLALEWDTEYLRGLEAQVSPAGVRVRKWFEVPRPNVTDPAADWLKPLLAQAGIKSQPVLVTLPRETVVVRRLELPESPEDELPLLVRFQAGMKSSLALDELCLDYLPLPRREGMPGWDVLLATVPLASVQEIRRLTASAGLDFVSLRMNPVAAAELAARVEPPSDASGRRAALVISRHGERVEISVVRQQHLVFTHATRAAGETTEQQNQALLAEVSRALVALQGLNAVLKIEQAWLLGSEQEFPGLSAPLAQRLNAPVQVLDPFSLVECDGNLGLPEGNRGALASLVGSLLAQSQPRVPGIDFLAPRKPIVKPDHRRRKLTLAAGGAVLVALVAAVSYWRHLSELDDQISEQTQAAQKLARELKQGEPTLKSAAAVQEWVDGNVPWLDEMQELTRHMPGGDRVYFKEWRFEPPFRKAPGRMIAKGYAREREDVIELKRRLLTEAPRYQVQPQGIRPATNDNYYPWQFDAELHVVEVAEKPPAAKAPTAKSPAQGTTAEKQPGLAARSPEPVKP